MKKLFLFTICAFIGFAQAEIINVEMNKISTELEKLLPHLVDEQSFTSKKNEPHISKSLERLYKLFTDLKTHPQTKSPGIAITREVMTSQIKDTISIFKGPKKSFARYKINSALTLCISCHTQQPKGEQLKLFSNFNLEKTTLNDYSKAEFLFITREFNDSIKYYSKFIANYKKTDRDTNQLHSALNRKLTYFTRLTPDTGLAILSFNHDLENKNLPKSVTEEIKSWIKELAIKRSWNNFDAINASEAEMKKFIENEIKPSISDSPIMGLFDEKEVDDLLISGILFQYLNNHPESSLAPQTLYWLGKIDKRLNNNLFYSLGDLYLIECIEKYPKTATAKECYQEYEEEITFSYTGSAGTHLPKDVSDELKRLKQLIR